MTSRLAALLFSSTLLVGTSAFAQAPNVTVSIKPLHSLVTAVMEGVGEPKLIVDGAASPHSFNLRPSNAKDLQTSDIVFWLGNGFETFLVKPLETLSGGAVAIKLSDAPNITKLDQREGGAFEPHDHSHGGEGHGAEAEHDHAEKPDEHAKGEHSHDHDHAHDHDETDLHLWLDPKNAIAITTHISNILSAHDGENAATYKKNAAAYIAEIEKTDSEVKAELSSVKDKTFIVFHDAYQYFEHTYGLKAAGSITVNPETPPGAERIEALRQKVKDANVTCIFAEPQFEPKVIKIISEGTDVKTGTLDPEATGMEPSKNLYIDLLKNLSTSFKTCLSK